MALSSDSDTISITSTALSEQKDEYPVEAILAETLTGDGKNPLYLVKWEGYPITRATWEPAASFDDETTLLDWETKKYRQDRGLEPAFDIKDFQAQLKAAESAKAKRKARRKAKKKRLGIPTSSDEDSDKAPIRSSRPKKRSTVVEDDGDDGDDDSDIGEYRKVKKGGKKRRHSDQNSDEGDDGLTSDDSLLHDIKAKQLSKKNKRLRKEASTRESRSSTEQAPSRPHPEPASRRPSTGTAAQGRQPSRRTSDVSVHQTDAAKPARATARRAHNVQAAKITSNVLANWNKEPPKRNVTRPDYNNPHVPAANPHLFGKLSVMRRYEKAGRNERAPQEGALQLFKPGEWNRRPFNKTQSGDSEPSQGKNRDEIPGGQDYEFNERNEGKGGLDAGTLGLSRAPHSAGTQFRRPSQDTGIGRALQTPRPAYTSSPSKFPQASGSQTRPPSQAAAADAVAAVQAPRAQPQHPSSAGVAQKPPVRKLTLTEYNQRCAAAAAADGKDKECSDKTNFENKVDSQGIKDTKDKLPDEEILRALEAIDSSTGFPEEQSNFNTQKKIIRLPGVIASVKIGLSKVEAGRLRLIGVPPDLLQKWINLVGSDLYLWLKDTVSAEHFKKNWEPNKAKVLGEGDIQRAFESSPDDLLDLLHFYGGAGVHVNKHFAMIIYPAGVEAWQYMKQSSTSSVGQLRWTAFIPYGPDDSSKPAWHSINTDIATRSIYKQLFRIRYSDLIPPPPENPQPNKVPRQACFIMADTSFAWNEFIMLCKFLKLCGATIFWSGQEGAWDYFSQNVTHGIVLVHNNYRRHGVASTPRLASVVSKNVSIFEFGRPYHVSESRRAVTNRGRFGCYRLFPHGGCVMLTDKMLINDPKSSYEILRWYKKKITDSKSNTWKLILRPGDVMSWYLHAMVSKVDVDKEDPATLTARNDIYQEICGLMYNPPGGEHDNPDRFDIQQIAGNDMLGENDPFIQFANLAIWADSNCTKFRRFIAVNPTQIAHAESFPVVEVLWGEQFLRKYGR